MKKIVIIYQKAGGGHLSLAQTVEQALYKYYPRKFKVIMYDPFPEIYNKSYELLNTDLQYLWGLGWHSSNNAKGATAIQKASFFAVGAKIAKFLSKEKPDIILSNAHPIVYSLELVLKKINLRTKTIIHIADPYSIHLTWLTNNSADAYLSPTKEATEFAIKNGVSPKKILTVGWPIRNSFYDKGNPEIIRKKYSLIQNKILIFIGGSGQGGGKIYELCEEIFKRTKIMKNCQIVINTGRNKTLLKKLQKCSYKLPNIQLIPYTPNISELMSIADIVIGKAGPNFMYETISLLKPYVAIGALPGQEEGNLEYIKRDNLGWVETDPKKAALLTEKLISNKTLLKSKVDNQMRAKATLADTDKKIADAIYKILY